jgi:hypothetical protein
VSDCVWLGSGWALVVSGCVWLVLAWSGWVRFGWVQLGPNGSCWVFLGSFGSVYVKTDLTNLASQHSLTLVCHCSAPACLC